MVWDYIKYFREHEISFGPGGSSAAGSFANLALRIGVSDSISFNWLFERFLYPLRRRMPEIGIELSVEVQDQALNYVSERYGREKLRR